MMYCLVPYKMLNLCALMWTDLNITQINLPEKEGHDYGYAVFEPLADINISSNKCTPGPPVTVTSVDVKDDNYATVDHNDHAEVCLLLSKANWGGTFCRDIIKLINERNVICSGIFLNDEKLLHYMMKNYLHKVVRKDDKFFGALVVPQALIK